MGAAVFRVGPEGYEGYDPSASPCPTAGMVSTFVPSSIHSFISPGPIPRAASNTGCRGRQEKEHAALPADTALFSATHGIGRQDDAAGGAWGAQGPGSLGSDPSSASCSLPV